MPLTRRLINGSGVTGTTLVLSMTVGITVIAISSSTDVNSGQQLHAKTGTKVGDGNTALALSMFDSNNNNDEHLLPMPPYYHPNSHGDMDDLPLLIDDSYFYEKFYQMTYGSGSATSSFMLTSDGTTAVINSRGSRPLLSQDDPVIRITNSFVISGANGARPLPWKIGDQIRTVLFVLDVLANTFLLAILIVQSAAGGTCFLKSKQGYHQQRINANCNSECNTKSNKKSRDCWHCFFVWWRKTKLPIIGYCMNRTKNDADNQQNLDDNTNNVHNNNNNVTLNHPKVSRNAAPSASPSVLSALRATTFSLTVLPYASAINGNYCQHQVHRLSNKPSRRHFLQKFFLASLAVADIFGGVGVFSRVLLPHLGVPYLCNEFPSVICLKIANLLILFSLAGCSVDHCLAVLWPLFHLTRSDLLANAYILVTIVMWIAVILLVGLEYVLPIKMLQKCVDSGYADRTAGSLVTLWDFDSLRDFCSVVICHHNYATELIQFAVWLFIAAVILVCYVRLMFFLIGHRRRLVKTQSSAGAGRCYSSTEIDRAGGGRGLMMSRLKQTYSNQSNTSANKVLMKTLVERRNHENFSQQNSDAQSVISNNRLPKSSFIPAHQHCLLSAVDSIDTTSSNNNSPNQMRHSLSFIPHNDSFRSQNNSSFNHRCRCVLTPASSLRLNNDGTAAVGTNNVTITGACSSNGNVNNKSSTGSSSRQPLKGVILTVGIIATFAVIWLPRMIVEAISSYVDYQNSGDESSTKIIYNVMEVTEILLLLYCCVLPVIYGVNVLFLVRRSLAASPIGRRSSTSSMAKVSSAVTAPNIGALPNNSEQQVLNKSNNNNSELC